MQTGLLAILAARWRSARPAADPVTILAALDCKQLPQVLVFHDQLDRLTVFGARYAHLAERARLSGTDRALRRRSAQLSALVPSSAVTSAASEGPDWT